MPLWVCSGCWEDIPVLKARIHCLECEDTDFCANCFVVKRYSKTHKADHRTVLEERSGLESGHPSSTTSPASGGIIPTPTSSSSPAQVSNVQAQVYSPPRNALVQNSIHSPNHVSPVPMMETIRTIQPIQHGLETTVELGNWQPLFDGTQPTQMMVDLLTAIFICLDTTGSRLLAPEQYSSFLEVQGYSIDEDVCKFPFNPKFDKH